MDEQTPTGEVDLRAKYDTKAREQMAKDGSAMPDESYPIKDQEDLENAIRMVGLGNASGTAIRKHIIARAGALGLSRLIPDTWQADGSVKRANSVPRRKARHRAVPLSLEVRHFAAEGLELRAGDPTGTVVELVGQPIMYDRPYAVRDLFGEFQETMAPGVATASLSHGADVRFLFNHDGLPLARTLSDTLTFTDGPSALTSIAKLDTRQQLANDLIIAIERGDVSQMSCGFVVAEDEWDEAAENRTIYRFDAFLDVSAVTYPASPTTSLQVARRMALEIPVESRARLRQLTVDLRAGKVLSSGNQAKLVEAVSTLHSVLEDAGVDPASLIDESGDGSEGSATTDDATEGTSDDATEGTSDVQRLSEEAASEDRAQRSDAPASREERRSASLSFTDQRGVVYQALCDHLNEDNDPLGPDVWIVDLGADWVVYEDWDEGGPSLNRLSYSIDGTTVTFSGDPEPVNSLTSYVPVSKPGGDEQRNADVVTSITSSRAKRLRLELEARKRRRPAA